MKERTEGLCTLNHTLLMGLSSRRRVFGAREHFRASLTLLELINNVSLIDSYLDPACAGGGSHLG